MLNKILDWGLEIILPIGILIAVSNVLSHVIRPTGYESIGYVFFFSLMASLQMKGYRNILKASKSQNKNG